MGLSLKLVSVEKGLMDESSLIVAAQKGDRQAFKKIYDMHVAKVYALCFRLSADKSLAEDACQEVFIQLWKKIGNYNGDSKFSTWLHSVTSNVTVSYIRKQKGWWHRAFNIDDTDTTNQVSNGSIADTDLEKYIFMLPERARWVFVLHAIEGYRHEEISKILNMAVGSSKAQFHRAKQLMKEWIENE